MERSKPIAVRLVLAAFLLSGAAALIYEVVWTRALSLVLGSTTYAVSTMLATFMAGLALGAWLGGRLADSRSDPLRLFGYCELGIGLFGIASLPLIYALPRAYLALYRSFHLYPGLFFPMQILLCASVMLMPTVLMGATFPLVSRAITGGLEELGRKVGSAYTFNTLGAVAGSLAAGFLLIPTIGLRGAVLAAGVLNLIVGSVIVARSGSARRGLVALVLLLYLPAAAWVWGAEQAPTLFSFYSAYRFLEEPLPYSGIVERDRAMLEPVFEGDYFEGPIRAFRTHDGHLLLQAGGKIEGTGTPDIANTLLLAYLPIATHVEPQSMLVIGLGAGVTLQAAKEQVERVDLVEIHPGVLEVVSRFGPAGLLDDVEVIRNDARNHLMATTRRWDIISSEPSYPTEAMVGNLFTREFFDLAAERLEPGGLFTQWLPYHLLTNADVTMMIKTFTSVFPHAMLWKIPDGLDLILVGSRELFGVGPEEIQRRVAEMNTTRWPLRYELSRGPEEIAQIAAMEGVPVNTDDLPILEFHVVRNLRVGNLALMEQRDVDSDRAAADGTR